MAIYPPEGESFDYPGPVQLPPGGGGAAGPFPQQFDPAMATLRGAPSLYSRKRRYYPEGGMPTSF